MAIIRDWPISPESSNMQQHPHVAIAAEYWDWNSQRFLEAYITLGSETLWKVCVSRRKLLQWHRRLGWTAWS